MTLLRTRGGPAPEGPAGLVQPGTGGGLLEVLRHRYLLRLLVRKELRVRYQGSVLGFAWSYVQPAVQFCVYYFVLGGVLDLKDSIENYPVHVFSAIVLIHFFNETFNAGTRSVVRNKALVRKIYLPREMFPVASLLVSAAHLGPGLVILLIGALATGWSFSWLAIGSALLGFLLMALFGLAVALLFSACNVFFRDFQQIVSVLGIIITWSVPMIYSFTMVTEAFPDVIVAIYLANPLAIAVMLFQRGFWVPSVDANPEAFAAVEMPADLFTRGFVMLGVVTLLVVLAQLVFRRLERRFAEEM